MSFCAISSLLPATMSVSMAGLPAQDHTAAATGVGLRDGRRGTHRTSSEPLDRLRHLLQDLLPDGQYDHPRELLHDLLHDALHVLSSVDHDVSGNARSFGAVTGAARLRKAPRRPPG